MNYYRFEDNVIIRIGWSIKCLTIDGEWRRYNEPVIGFKGWMPIKGEELEQLCFLDEL